MKHPMMVVLAAALLLGACDSDDGDAPAGDTFTDTPSDAGDTGGTTGIQPDTRDAADPGPPVDLCDTDLECDDGLWCNGPERCAPDTPDANDFGCAPGVAPQGTDPDPTDCTVLGPCDEETQSFPEIVLSPGDPCDDGIACTAGDVCGDDDTCAGTPDDSRCDDLLFCNGVESCSATLGCLPGMPPMGTDADPTDCLVPGPCEEATQSFVLVPAETGLLCDDGVECTTSDACTSAGTCEGDPDHGLCADDLFCNGAEQCVVGVGCDGAVGPTPPEDEDPNDCMVPGPCDEDTDGFPLVAAEAGAACDDEVACTTGDACDDAGQCLGAADDGLCDDGDVCDGDETCSATDGCQEGTALEEPDDPDPTDCQVVPAECSPADGWALVPAEDGVACDDGVSCTTDDECASGTCAGTLDDAPCDDENPCTTDTCTASGCDNTPVEDGLECGTGGECVEGLCEEP